MGRARIPRGDLSRYIELSHPRSGSPLVLEEEVEALEPGRLDGEEVGRQHLGCMLADELSPGDLTAARASGKRWLRRILINLNVEMRNPSLRASPWMRR